MKDDKPEHDGPVDAPPDETPVEPETPNAPPVKPSDGEDPPPDFGVPVGPGKGP